MALTIEPIKSSFAALVNGISIRDGIDDDTFAMIERAFEEHSVLVFPNQPVTDEEQVAFSERFGPLEGTIAGVVGSGSKVVRVSNMLPDGTLKEPGGHLSLFGRANSFWHTDSSFRVVPAKASLLSARIIPDEGGDTEFASTRAAFESLDADEQARLDGLVAVHSLAYSRRQLSPDAISPEQEKALPPVEQALVRTNPVTGRKSLLIGAHVRDIVGMPHEEAQSLLSALLERATRPEFTYRHCWSVGDIVMWDNRAVLHRGHSYDEVGSRRLLIRTTLAGDGPTAADGRVLAAA